MGNISEARFGSTWAVDDDDDDSVDETINLESTKAASARPLQMTIGTLTYFFYEVDG